MKKCAKIFTIIGMIATPLAHLWTTVCLLFVYFIGVLYAPFAIALSVLAIVIGIKALKQLNTATCRAEFPVKWGVLTIIFTSAVSGVLMLCMQDTHFKD